MNFIEVNTVNKKYGENAVLKDVSLTIPKGTFTSIVGPIGSGKTTLLKMLSGLISDYQGTISVNGLDPNVARKRKKIGYSAQKPTLLPWRTVIQNINLPQEITGVSNSQKAFDLLKLIKLENYAISYPRELSGGMQQLISILRSLLLDPDLLLLDEPFSSVDEISKFKFQNELKSIHSLTNKTTIMITHSIPEAIYLSNLIIVLSSRPGRIKKILEINLKNRNEDILYTKEFLHYSKTLRDELINE